jgi:glycosyltransferase involved in cell wall biosynthesis
MSDHTIAAPSVAGALAQRLRAAAPILVPTAVPQPDADPARDASILLELIVTAVRDNLSHERMWLLLVVVSGSYPTGEQVRDGVRHFELSDHTGSMVWLLDESLERAREIGDVDRDINIVSGCVIVDVDHTARHDLHTGIQQVIRNTIPHWVGDHEIVLAAWTGKGGALRGITPVERGRVVDWYGSPATEVRVSDDEDSDVVPLIVPWRSVIVLPDVSMPEVVEELAGLARWTANRVVTIGYDCIPAVSADMIPVGGSNRFIRYLSAVKYMDRVVAISASAAVEFQGYVDTLPTQGLIGPVVVECALPAERGPNRPPAASARTGPSIVLAVGSFEPRKNHLALLYAAESLWREGLEFELDLIGGMGWGTDVPKLVEDLQRSGRVISMRYRVSNGALQEAYARARFTVFASLHEGYGLPVAESVAAGVPSITADFGSTAEIARAGGVVTIDPRDDDALIAAMRSLLTDDERLDLLRSEILARPSRSWADYAGELWQYGVAPELAVLTKEQTA